LKLRNIPNAAQDNLQQLVDIFSQIEAEETDLSERIFDLFFEFVPPDIESLLQETDSEGFIEIFDRLFNTSYSSIQLAPEDYVEKLLERSKKKGATDDHLEIFERAFDHLKKHPSLYAFVSDHLKLLEPGEDLGFSTTAMRHPSLPNAFLYGLVDMNSRDPNREADIREVADTIVHEVFHLALRRYSLKEFVGGPFGETAAKFVGALAKTNPGEEISPQRSIKEEKDHIGHWKPSTEKSLPEVIGMTEEKKTLLQDLLSRYETTDRWEPLFLHSVKNDMGLALGLASNELRSLSINYEGDLTETNIKALNKLTYKSRYHPLLERATLLHIYHNFDLFWSYANLREGIKEAAFFESGENRDISAQVKERVKAAEEGADFGGSPFLSLREYRENFFGPLFNKRKRACSA